MSQYRQPHDTGAALSTGVSGVTCLTRCITSSNTLFLRCSRWPCSACPLRIAQVLHQSPQKSRNIWPLAEACQIFVATPPRIWRAVAKAVALWRPCFCPLLQMVRVQIWRSLQFAGKRLSQLSQLRPHPMLLHLSGHRPPFNAFKHLQLLNTCGRKTRREATGI